ncbi:MAG: hypothetical protein LQ339_005238 [Xanthoria mediterranea]|nr:MAG: hypothetical protein LQ339_005238 [Xanthoria mediterranea]
MGTWGPGLYQSDIDHEMLDFVTDEVVKMVSHPDCLRSSMMPEFFTLRAPIDRAATVQQLEDRVLHRLVRRFNHQKNQGAIVILGVVCMELGVKINPEDMLSIKMALMRWDVNKIKKDQVRHAFESYQNNGAVWRFDARKAVEMPLSPQDMTAVDRKTDAEDEAVSTVTRPTTRVRSQSESTINARYDAQLARLEKILLESESPASSSAVPTRVPTSPARRPKKQERITSWLPATGPEFVCEDRQIYERKPGESMFTLSVPVRGRSEAATVGMARGNMSNQHSESMYQVLGQFKPRSKGKEATTPTTTVKKNRSKLSLGRNE